MNYFKEAEYILYNYSKLCIALNNLKTRKSHLIWGSAPSGKISTGAACVGSGSNYSNNAEKDLTELNQTMANILITENKINEIDSLLCELACEERAVIQLWYFEMITKENMLEKLNIGSLDSLYKKRKKAVGDFAILYFGAVALNLKTAE